MFIDPNNSFICRASPNDTEVSILGKKGGITVSQLFFNFLLLFFTVFSCINLMRFKKTKIFEFQGTIIMSNFTSCHRDPAYWKSPLDFLPSDHFLDEAGKFIENKPGKSYYTISA
jgi:hypothetical protein